MAAPAGGHTPTLEELFDARMQLRGLRVELAQARVEVTKLRLALYAAQLREAEMTRERDR